MQKRDEIKNKVARMIKYALQSGASDLHIIPKSCPYMRCGHLLQPTELPVLNEKHTVAMISSIVNPNDLKKLQENYSVDFVWDIPDLARIRGQAFRQLNGYAAVLRIVPKVIPTIRELKLPLLIEKISLKKRGIFVVSGPANSGKTTTIAACIDYINTYESAHIITVEDPIEYIQKNKKCLISQRQLGRDTHTYVDAVISALREDPDVILMGEMRDSGSINAAITAAETGHFVISSIQSLGVLQAIERIINFFPANEESEIRNQLSLNLVGVLSQVLLPTPDGLGRCLAFELLPLLSQMRSLIRENKMNQLYSQMTLGKKSNCITFKDCIKDLISKNKVDKFFATEMMESFEA
ncbi:type IV pilus twitching motility protein PilT [Candidatus Riflebacteria bacterium]